MTDEAAPALHHLADLQPAPGSATEVYATEHSRLLLLRVEAGASGPAETGRVWSVLQGSLRFEGEDAPAAEHDLVLSTTGPVEGEGLALAYDVPGDLDLPAGAPRRASARPDRVQRNQFLPLLDTPQVAAALLGIAAGRRLDAGPESERTFIPLRGSGLLFLENETTIPWEAGDVLVVPPGWPARIWARGPEDAALLVLQAQKAAPAERRTLASEIRRRRADEE